MPLYSTSWRALRGRNRKKKFGQVARRGRGKSPYPKITRVPHKIYNRLLTKKIKERKEKEK